MCIQIRTKGHCVGVLCTDRGSKAPAVFKIFFPNVIVQYDDWHDLSKLDAYFKDHFKNIPNFDDKIIPLRYFSTFFNLNFLFLY